MDTETILETYRKKVADGDSKGAEQFLLEHFKELSQDVQGDALLGWIQDAAQNETSTAEMVIDTAGLATQVLENLKVDEESLSKLPEE